MLFKKGVAEHCFRRIGVPFCLFVAIQSIIAAKIGDLRFGGNTGSTKKDDVLALLYQLGQAFDFFGHKDTPFRALHRKKYGFRQKNKVFARAFYKKLVVSRGEAFGRLPQKANHPKNK